MDDDTDWRVVRRFNDQLEAEMARGLLVSQGLECSIQASEMVAQYWGLTGVMGGVALRVPAEQVEHAEAVLDEAASRHALEGRTIGPITRQWPRFFWLGLAAFVALLLVTAWLRGMI